MAGLVVYFALKKAWFFDNIIDFSARIVSDVLFNALVFGLIIGFVLSIIIFPLQYFLIKKSSRVTAVVFFIAGFLSGIAAGFIKFIND